MPIEGVAFRGDYPDICNFFQGKETLAVIDPKTRCRSVIRHHNVQLAVASDVTPERAAPRLIRIGVDPHGGRYISKARCRVSTCRPCGRSENERGREMLG